MGGANKPGAFLAAVTFFSLGFFAGGDAQAPDIILQTLENLARSEQIDQVLPKFAQPGLRNRRIINGR
jgi:hypothetical protein